MINTAKLDKKNYHILKKMCFFYFNRKKRAVYRYYKKQKFVKKNEKYSNNALIFSKICLKFIIIQ